MRRAKAGGDSEPLCCALTSVAFKISLAGGSAPASAFSWARIFYSLTGTVQFLHYRQPSS